MRAETIRDDIIVIIDNRAADVGRFAAREETGRRESCPTWINAPLEQRRGERLI